MKKLLRALTAVCFLMMLAVSSPALAAEDNTQEIVSGGNTRTEAETSSATVLVTAVIEAPKDPGGTDSDPSSPKTGDATRIVLFIVAAAASAGIIVFCLRKLQENQKS